MTQAMLERDHLLSMEELYKALIFKVGGTEIIQIIAFHLIIPWRRHIGDPTCDRKLEDLRLWI